MRTALLSLCAIAAAIAAPTRVVGSINDAANQPLNGTAVLSWRSFTSQDGLNLYPTAAVRIPITTGAFDARIEPGLYVLEYAATNGSGKTTLYLAVPASGSTVQLTACILSDTTRLDPSQLARAGANTGQVLTWDGSAWRPATAGAIGQFPISQVTGLQTVLDSKAAAADLTTEVSARSAAITAEAAARQAHEARIDNPHAVTAAQIGQLPIAQVTSLQTALDSKAATADLTTEVSARSAAITAEAAARAAHEARTDNPHAVTAAQAGAAQQPYSAAITAQTSAAITAATHGLTSSAITATCYDTTGALTEPDTVTVAASRDVTITFATPFTGRCVLR